MATKVGRYTYVSHTDIGRQGWDLTVNVDTGFWWNRIPVERVFTGGGQRYWHDAETGFRVKPDVGGDLEKIKNVVETRSAYKRRQLQDLKETDL